MSAGATPSGAATAPNGALGARAQALVHHFRALFGAEPEGVWAAPGRVNLIGEHTDYNAGFALPLGIEQCALVSIRRRADDVIRLASTAAGRTELVLADAVPGRVTGWAAYVAGVAWAAREAGARASGFDLVLDSDVPMGAGLSSSAAVECATALGLCELWGAPLERLELARLAQRTEVEVAGVPCGLMDQLASCYAEPGCALFVDFQSLEVEVLALPLDAAGLDLLVIDTRAPHQLADGAYAERRRTCERAAAALGLASLREATLPQLEASSALLGALELKRARHVVSENARVLAAVSALRSVADTAPGAALGRLGPLLSASHASLREDFEVTVPHLDVAAAAAEAAGALGARMVGGGFGGSVLALVAQGQLRAVSEAVCAAYAACGWAEPQLLHVSAGAGARRVL